MEPNRVRLTQYLENVQRRFTKRLRSLRGMSYEQRLNYLQLESLEARHKQADLLVVFKVMRRLLYTSILIRLWNVLGANVVPTVSALALILHRVS